MSAIAAAIGAARPVTRRLYDIAQVLESTADVEMRLGTVLSLLEELVPYDQCVLLCAEGLAAPRVTAQPRLALDAVDPVRAALEHLLRLLAESGASDGRDGSELGDGGMVDWASRLAVPLVGLDEVIGILAVWRRAPDAYAEADVSLLSVVAAQLAAYLAALGARRRADETRDDLDRMREQFLAAAAHDLKTPLTVVRGHAQLARQRLARQALPEAQGLADALEVIEASSMRMIAQINELVDITRQQLGTLPEMQCEPTDVVDLVRHVVAVQRESSSYPLRFETESRSIVVCVDAERMARVLENLIGNAIKYSPSGMDIVVRASQEEADGHSWFVVRVQDQGIGIPAADLPRVFERFYRAGNVGERVPGTGIGLTSARQIVQQHGGTIAVESTEGMGSTFTVRLPLAEGTT